MRQHGRCLLFALFALFALPFPKGYAEEGRAHIHLFPQRVLLGQPFVYRVTLRLPRGATPQIPQASVFLPAMLLKSPRVSQISARDIQWRISLALFDVRQFGEITIPAWRLSFQRADGSASSLPVPSSTIHVAPQFKEGQRFQDADDPAWTFLPKPTPNLPSTEWRFAGLLLPKEPTDPRIYFAFIALLALILASVLFAWLRRRPTAPPPPPPSPLDLALAALRKIPLPPTEQAESIGRFYQSISKIFRTYLFERTQTPASTLTTRELHEALSPIHPPWLESLTTWLFHLDTVRFSGTLPHAQEVSLAKEHAQRLLLEIDRWQQTQDARMAQSLHAAPSPTSSALAG